MRETCTRSPWVPAMERTLIYMSDGALVNQYTASVQWMLMKQAIASSNSKT